MRLIRLERQRLAGLLCAFLCSTVFFPPDYDLPKALHQFGFRAFVVCVQGIAGAIRLVQCRADSEIAVRWLPLEKRNFPSSARNGKLTARRECQRNQPETREPQFSLQTPMDTFAIRIKPTKGWMLLAPLE
jgi:hypothetical protein